MYKTLITICFLYFGIVLFDSCILVKQKSYNYSIGLFQLDTTKRLLSESNYISYKEYLFEFNTNIKTNSEIKIFSKTNSSFVTRDTPSVYLITKDGMCYEFDSFRVNNKILKKFPLRDKPYGMKIGPKVNDGSTDNMIFSPPEKAFENNVPYHFSIARDKVNANDSVELKFILFKAKDFHSLYEYSGYKFSDSRYCIVGISLFDKIRKIGITEEFLERRELTDFEVSICLAMSKAITKDRKITLD
jgi:hypothetical protein